MKFLSIFAFIYVCKFVQYHYVYITFISYKYCNICIIKFSQCLQYTLNFHELYFKVEY